MSLPTKHRGFVVTERGKIEMLEQDLLNCSDSQVLVKVKAIAINPADWKVCVFFGLRVRV
jgi:NADPH:quinone reductase-like Zn-dependent oxidoreductase